MSLALLQEQNLEPSSQQEFVAILQAPIVV